MTNTVAVTNRAGSAEQQYKTALAMVTTPSFSELSAREKQETLWDFISQVPYEPLPAMRVSDFQTLSRLINRVYLHKASVLDDDVASRAPSHFILTVRLRR